MTDNKMTDAELVEAVAREVLGWEDAFHFSKDRLVMMNTALESFDPFHDMNDLFRMLEKFDNWQVDKMTTQDGSVNHQVIMYDGEIIVIAETLPRAVLEAALEAKEDKP